MNRDQHVDYMANVLASGNRNGCPGCDVGSKKQCFVNATALYNANVRVIDEEEIRKFKEEGEKHAATMFYLFVNSFLNGTSLERIGNDITNFIKDNFKLDQELLGGKK